MRRAASFVVLPILALALFVLPSALPGGVAPVPASSGPAILSYAIPEVITNRSTPYTLVANEPVTWTCVSCSGGTLTALNPSLEAGLHINETTAGSYTFSVEATVGSQNVYQNWTFSAVKDPAITSVPSFYVSPGVGYVYAPTVANPGAGTWTFSGAPYFSFSASTGTISASSPTAGTYENVETYHLGSDNWTQAWWVTSGTLPATIPFSAQLGGHALSVTLPTIDSAGVGANGIFLGVYPVATFGSLLMGDSYRVAWDGAWNYTFALASGTSTAETIWYYGSPGSTPSLFINGVSVAVSALGSSGFASRSTSGSPSSPTGLSITNAGQTNLTASWTNPSGVLTNVSESVGTVCGSWLETLSIGVVSTHLVGGLLPETQYCIQIVAWNAYGAGSPATVIGSTLTATGPLGSRNGAIPVEPNIYSPYFMDARSFAGNNSEGVVEIVTFSQTIETGGTLVSCLVVAGSCYQLKNAYANVSNPFGSANLPIGSKLLWAQTWVNTTLNCGTVACPAGFLGCDQTFYAYGSSPITSVSRPCYSTGVIWSPGAPGQVPQSATLPVYNVTRVVAFEYELNQSWSVVGRNGVLTVNQLSVSPVAFGTLTTTHLVYWAVPSVYLSVPFPSWRWALPLTNLFWANGTVYTTNFSVSSPAAVEIEWSGFPVTFCLLCGTGGTPAGGATIEQFYLTLVSSVGTPVIGNHGNQTGGLPPSTLVLTLGNQTGIGGGEGQASVTWNNTFSLPFNGSVVLQAGFLYNSVVVSVANGSVFLPASEFLVVDGSVTILQGSLSIGAGKILSVEVDYVENATVTVTGTLAYLNGIAITLPLLIAGTTLVAALVYAFLRLQASGSIRARALIAIFVFGLAMWIVVMLGGLA